MSRLVKIPFGENRELDELQLKREIPRDYNVIDSLADSFEIVKKNPIETIVSMFVVGFGYFMVYFLVYLVLIALSVTGVLVADLFKEVDETLAQVLLFGVVGVAYVVVIGVMLIAQSVAMGAYTICVLKVVRGQELDLAKDLGSVKRFIKPLAVTYLLFSLAVMLGMFGFIIGAYFVMFGCLFAQILVVDKNITGIQALKASWRITDGHKLSLLGFMLAAQLLNVTGMLACGVGMIFTMAMTMVAMLTIYDALVEPGNSYNAEEISAKVFV